MFTLWLFAEKSASSWPRSNHVVLCPVKAMLHLSPSRPWSSELGALTTSVCRGGRSSDRTTAGGKVRLGSHTRGVNFCLRSCICSVKCILSPSLSVYKEDMEEKRLPHRAITNNLDRLNEELSLVPGKCSRNVFALLKKWKTLAKTPRSIIELAFQCSMSESRAWIHNHYGKLLCVKGFCDTLFFFLLVYLVAVGFICGMWDFRCSVGNSGCGLSCPASYEISVPQPEIESIFLWIGGYILNYLITREFPWDTPFPPP